MKPPPPKKKKKKKKQGRNNTFTPCPTSCAIFPTRPCGTCYVLSVNDAIVKVCFAFNTILYANHPQKSIYRKSIPYLKCSLASPFFTTL